jgi:hypothetical protein
MAAEGGGCKAAAALRTSSFDKLRMRNILMVSLSNHWAYSAFTMGKRERDSSSKIGTVLRI